MTSELAESRSPNSFIGGSEGEGKDELSTLREQLLDYEHQVAKGAGQEEHIRTLSHRNDELRAMLERKGDEVLPVRAMETRILTLEAELEKQSAFMEAQRISHEAETLSYKEKFIGETAKIGEVERAKSKLSTEADRLHESLTRERAMA